jgi:hypothetical protein
MSLTIDYTPPPTGKKFMESDAKMRVLMGPVGCVAPETQVLTEFGPMPIWQIDRPMRVVSWNDQTCQFQLSWCGGAFPKGTDYLYRVSTPSGIFDATGHHLTLSSDRTYLPVRSFYQGQFLRQCSSARQLTKCAHLLPSPQDADHLMKTAVGCLGDYAESARRYGLRLLQAEGIDLEFVPSPDGVRVRAPLRARLGDFLERVQMHSRLRLSTCLTSIGGYAYHALHLLAGAVDRAFSLPFAHSAATDQPVSLSLLTTGSRLITPQSFSCSGSLNIHSLANGAIMSIERQDVKRSYWDMQVLDTNNYVTVDGCIHHNSGKSVTCSFEVIRRASMQEPDSTGIRRTRAAIVRETARQLQDTTIKTFLDWFPPGVCGRYMRTTKTYFFKVADVECEVMFRALDDADDVANLNSLELTFAWFNECRDIHPDIVDAMSKRIGRFPSKRDTGPTWHGMWGDTNPPIMDSWWYYQMEHINPEDGVSLNENGWDVFKQPSGRSPYAENVENLPEGYYDTQGRSDEYVRVYIDGEYGLSSAGQPVYKYFRTDYHMAKEPIRPIVNGVRPLVVGMDLGLTPAAVIGQLDPRGRALILAEAVSKDMGVQRFTRTVLKPLLMEKFPGMNIIVVVDPAGIQRAQTDERTAVDIIKAEGLRVMPAKTNAISARINAVDDYLMRQVDGDPGFLMDPGCSNLKSAMMGGYRYKKNIMDTIEKNHASHIAEALQYLMLHIASAQSGSGLSTRREVKTISSLGWT